MSLINDALKRAQEDKERNTQTPADEPQMEVSSSPRPRRNNRVVVLLLVGVLAAAGGWYFLYGKKHTPAAASANSNLLPVAQPAIPKIVPNAPATRPAVAQAATSEPAVAIRPRVRVVAPPPGGLAAPSPTTQNVPPSPGTLDSTATGTRPAAFPGPLANLMIPLSGPLGAPPPAAAGEPGPSALRHSTGPTTAPALAKVPDKHGEAAQPDKPPATAAKNTPETQPAKPERAIATAASVALQFHVSCIMFSDQGSTAIINGSPVKVGQTIRADGVAKTGLPDEAVVKKIERSCVEVELDGERFLLRI